MKLKWEDFVRRRKFLLFVGWGKHLFYIRLNGDFMACGQNRDGQLSLGDRKDRSVPEVVSTFEGKTISDVATGQHGYSLFVTAQGIPWACGNNGLGQLSISQAMVGEMEDFPPILVAKKVELPSQKRIVRVFCDAYKSSYWLTIDGDVYSCGYNSSGQLGMGSPKDFGDLRLAERIPTLDKIVNITTGYEWALFIKEDGSLFACGYNWDGPFALGDTKDRSIPTEITFFRTKGLVVLDVVSTYHTMYYLTKNSQTYVCGRNGDGELGMGKKSGDFSVPRLSKVMSGMETYCRGTSLCFFVFKKDGKIYGVGENRGSDDFSRMGLGYDSKRVYFPEEIVELTGKNIVQIETCIKSTFVVSRKGEVYGVGDGTDGQFMNGKEECFHKFIQLGIKVKMQRLSGEMKERVQRLNLIVERSEILELLLYSLKK